MEVEVEFVGPEEVAVEPGEQGVLGQAARGGLQLAELVL